MEEQGRKSLSVSALFHGAYEAGKKLAECVGIIVCTGGAILWTWQAHFVKLDYSTLFTELLVIGVITEALLLMRAIELRKGAFADQQIAAIEKRLNSYLNSFMLLSLNLFANCLCVLTTMVMMYQDGGLQFSMIPNLLLGLTATIMYRSELSFLEGQIFTIVNFCNTKNARMNAEIRKAKEIKAFFDAVEETGGNATEDIRERLLKPDSPH